MIKQIFVNLPVKDLQKTKEFWEALGFTFNPQFTDETAASLVLGENIYAMLLTEDSMKRFTKKQIADANQVTEVINAVSVESRAKVDEIVSAAITAGARPSGDPTDYGWMYTKSFEDLDGHQWEILYIDETAVPENPSESVDKNK